MRARKLVALIILLLLFTGCGGEWINDRGNFKRIFGFEKPTELQVIQSYYWKSAHWTVEYRYYVEMDAPAEFFNKLTAMQLMDSSTSEIAAQAPCLTSNHKPSWFLPKTLNDYQAWVPKANSDYRVFRDKADGKIFVCDMRL
jgi:hypothetical protein